MTDVVDELLRTQRPMGTQSTDLQLLCSDLSLTGRDQTQQPAMDMLPCFFVQLVVWLGKAAF